MSQNFLFRLYEGSTRNESYLGLTFFQSYDRLYALNPFIPFSSYTLFSLFGPFSLVTPFNALSPFISFSPFSLSPHTPAVTFNSSSRWTKIPLYPALPKTQKELLLRKFRNGMRLVHRCPFARATDLFQITIEGSLEEYVKNYIKKRLEKIEKSDLSRSSFYNDIFYCDAFHKNKKDHLGHFFQRKRVKLMCERHRCLFILWLKFLSK